MRALIAVAVRSLCTALCVAAPITALAQQPGLAAADLAGPPLERRPYACVDPADVLARRVAQDVPCALPLYHRPAAEGLTSSDSWRRPLTLPTPPERERGHAMFWRFPVQPLGPYDAPRHSWR
jgi:hypothetical protein